MGAGHAHPLYLPGTSPVHRLPAEVKIIAALLGAVCVVATPREAFGVFAGHLLVLATVWAVARIPPGWILRRAVIELPFVVLAVLLPLTGPGPRVDVLGFALSQPGLLGAWNIVVKGTLGVLVSLTLAATTPLRDLLLGMQRLHAPALVVTIATLMLRYVDLIVAEAGRMRRARLSRGHDPRFLWQVGATAQGVGSLFVRAYERGERVHLAMLSRGFDGTLPRAAEGAPSRRQWVAGLVPAGRGRAARDRGWALLTVAWVACRSPRDRPAAVARGVRARVRLPGRPPGPARGRPADRAGRAGRAAGPQRRREDDARPAPQRHPAHRRGPGRRRRAAGGAGEPAGDPAPGRDRLPGPRRPAVHADGRRGRGVRAGELRGQRGGAAGACRRRAGRRGHGGATATAHRCTCPAGSAGVWRWPPCWPASPRSWCSTSRRATSTRWPPRAGRGRARPRPGHAC